MFSPEDVLLILIVAFFLFGANKLPEMARSLGKATGEFKKAQMESENEIKQLNKPLNDKDSKIRNLAMEMGISIENKTSEQLIEEIHSKVKSNEGPNVKMTDKYPTA
ncbi:Sec-independent protein translocase protein TatAt [uncultured archaeon]|nr:Sec-independent protein translocase protein TatAt [uncultured archaeon]